MKCADFCNGLSARNDARSDVARRHQHLIIGPWGHLVEGAIGELTFGDNAKIGEAAVCKQWLSHWLKGERSGVEKWPFLRLFVMGDNRWRDEDDWPLARTQFRRYYLHGGGSANTLGGDGTLNRDEPGAEPADRFIYDPETPVPTHGGEWTFFYPGGPLDQREIESRSDVLVYTITSRRRTTSPGSWF